MIGFSYFLILWLGVGFLTGFKALFVDQVYDEEFKQELIDSCSPGMQQNMAELFFKSKINIMVFYVLSGLLPVGIKIVGLLKRD
ncbi:MULTISPECIES: hypothetical protein [Bacillus]|uniref:hypothetical protein n=1 Tax=Bacillus TaxID=1386 RepID=UPI0003873C6D|nr:MULTISPECIES: hypothetical protein [Bacillus]MBU8885948.1 hypothetical protein [Bacillus sp. FJAT-27001]ODB63034.1 hypothetical protein A7313_19675 [Bacillus velezensis]CDG30057.1 hypothetical protein; phage SPbeta [Bacillus velezensis UCMB5033]